jgi:hypothetical protein
MGWTARTLARLSVLIVLVASILPDPATAHTAGSDNPVFEQVYTNNGVSFGNPRLVVANGSASVDISWGPCNVRWAEPTNIRIRGLDTEGVPVTGWQTLVSIDYSAYPNCVYPQPVHKTELTVTSISSAPIHEVEFVGQVSGAVFMRARDLTVEAAQALKGVSCRNTAVAHGASTSTCVYRGRNGLVAYDNPNFTVSGTAVDLDVNFDPCDRTWPEGVGAYIRGLSSEGAPATGWHLFFTFDYGSLSCMTYGFDLRKTPIHKHGLPLPSWLGGHPSYVLEFRGRDTGEKFLRAKSNSLPLIEVSADPLPAGYYLLLDAVDAAECARIAILASRACVFDEIFELKANGQFAYSGVIVLELCTTTTTSSTGTTRNCVPHSFAVPAGRPPELPDPKDPEVPPPGSGPDDWVPPAGGGEPWIWIDEEGTHPGWPTPDGKWKRLCAGQGTQDMESLHWDGYHQPPKPPHWAWKDCWGKLWEMPFEWTRYGLEWFEYPNPWWD